MTNRFLGARNIIEQVNSIKCKFPEFKIVYTHSRLKILGKIKPTSRSVEYEVMIKYKLTEYPEIWILNDALKRNVRNEEIPHMYNQERLCLFRPKYGEFRFSDCISETIIPWISLWLYHYENWHMTGIWDGGGEHPS